MIEQNAVVRHCDGGLALVEVQRANACGGCAGKAGCGTASFADYFGRRTARVSVRNPIGARPGEWVVVGYEERAFLRAAAVMYLLPIGALALGAAAGTAWGGSEALGVLGAAAGLAGGLAFSRRIADLLGRRYGGGLTILRHAAGGGPETIPAAARETSNGELR